MWNINFAYVPSRVYYIYTSITENGSVSELFLTLSPTITLSWINIHGIFSIPGLRWSILDVSEKNTDPESTQMPIGSGFRFATLLPRMQEYQLFKVNGSTFIEDISKISLLKKCIPKKPIHASSFKLTWNIFFYCAKIAQQG